MAVAKPAIKTRSSDNVWLIGHPCETITGARLPSGRDVMTNFVYYLRSHKLSVSESALQVHDQLVPFWEKSRLPIRQKQHIVRKIKDLYNEQVQLKKNRKRNKETDQLNQKNYTEKLEKLFDISHADSDKLIRNQEDLQFLKLQQESRTGSIGPLDVKLAAKETRSAERRERHKRRAADLSTPQASTSADATQVSVEDIEQSGDSDSSDESDDLTTSSSRKQTDEGTKLQRKRKRIISQTVAAVLDRTNTSVRKSTMILASVMNEAGEGPSTLLYFQKALSTATVNNVVKSLLKKLE